jgi:protein O-mannosyl-transferase
MINTRAFRSAITWFALGCCLVAFALVEFGPSLQSHFVSDDWLFLRRSSTAVDVRSFFTFTTGWFVRPMQWLVTWVLYRAYGLNPVPYHLTSVLMDCLNTMLFGFLTFKLLLKSGMRWRTCIVGAVLAATLFITNYRHHEAVFWYSSLSELLAASFRITALILVFYAVETEKRPYLRGSLYVLAILSYTVAILAKETAVILPVEILLLLCFLYLTDRPRTEGKLLRRGALLIPFMIVLVLWAGFYIITSPKNASAWVARGGSQTIHATTFEWLFRFIQFFNGNYLGTGFFGQRTAIMAIELTGCLAAAIIAFRRKKFLWIFALAWVFAAGAPTVATISTSAAKLPVPLLSLAVGDDRFFYYSAAGAALFLIVSALWVLEEARRVTGKKGLAVTTGILGLGSVLFLTLNMSRLVKSRDQWKIAGEIGNGILSQVVIQAPLLTADSTLCIADVPDNYEGKYVFRNGLKEALYLTYGVGNFAVRSSIQPANSFIQPTQLNTANCSYAFRYHDEMKTLSPLPTSDD